MTKRFDPNDGMAGGYLPLDGSIEFFGRLRSLLKPDDVVVDLGAGRGAWFYEDRCETRRRLRDIRPAVATLIGLDVDPVVLDNPTTTENRRIENGRLPLADASADAIVADYVLEHIEAADAFASEIDRVLKPGGYLVARTPHKYMYISIAARLVRNRHHTTVLAKAQPNRKAEDVFPTTYRLNTRRAIATRFPHYQDFSYLYAAEPAYHFGRRWVFGLMSAVHRWLPRVFVSNLFVFLRKPVEPAPSAGRRR